MGPRDFPLFGPHKKHQEICNRFCPEASYHHIITWLNTLDINVFKARIEALATWRSKCLNVWWLCAGLICITCYQVTCYIKFRIVSTISLLISFFIPLHPQISHIPQPVHVNELQIFTSLQTRSFSSLQSEKTMTRFWLLIQHSHLKWKHLRINNEVKLFAIITIKLQDITDISSTK